MEEEVEKYLTNSFNAELYLEISNKFDLDIESYPSHDIDANTFFLNLFETVSFIKENKFKINFISTEVRKYARKYPPRRRVDFYGYLIKVLCNEYDEGLHLIIKDLNKIYEGLPAELGIPYQLLNTAEDYFKSHEVFYLDPVAPGITWANHLKVRKEGYIEPLDKKQGLSQAEEVKYKKSYENKEGETSSRIQTLAIYYLNEHYGINHLGDRTKFARFVSFLTGKSYDNILKILKSPLSHNSPTEHRKVLEAVKGQFEKMGNKELSALVDKDLRSI